MGWAHRFFVKMLHKDSNAQSYRNRKRDSYSIPQQQKTTLHKHMPNAPKQKPTTSSEKKAGSNIDRQGARG